MNTLHKFAALALSAVRLPAGRLRCFCDLYRFQRSFLRGFFCGRF